MLTPSLAPSAHLSALVEALSESLTPEQVAEAVLTHAVRALGATAGIVSVLDAERSHLRLLGASGYSPEAVQLWRSIPTSARTPAADALRNQEPVWLESHTALGERYPQIRGRLSSLESASWAVVPLELKGQGVGTITLGFAAPRTFTEEDKRFTVSVAHQCAQALERARLYESERNARLAAEAAQRRFRFLAEASEVLAHTWDEQAIFQQVPALVLPRLADWVTIRVLSEAGQLQSPVLAHVDPAKEAVLREIQRTLDQSAGAINGVERILRTGDALLQPHIPEDILERNLGPALAEHFRFVGMKSSLQVPLSAQGHNLGVLTLASSREDRTFTQEDVLLARDLARRVALAIDNARTHEKERSARAAAERAAGRTLRLQSITAALSEAVTPLQVAQATLSQAIEGLSARSGAVWECRPGEETLELVSALHYSRAALEGFQRIPLLAPVPVAEAFRTAAPVWLESRGDYTARFPLSATVAHDEDDYSVACLPLVAQGRSMGALALSFHGRRAVNPEERAFLSTLATHCSHAFERARLYRETQEAIAMRDEFLSIASHELKTPLTSLKLLLQAALRNRTPELTERSLDKLQRADRQIGRLTELIQEMLDVSRIRTGRLKLDLSEVDLPGLMREVLAGFQEQSLQTGSVLHLEAAPALTGRWDRMRLEQVLTNLVSNALKYGKGQPVHIRLERQEATARITVMDRGIGIAQKEVASLFQPFQRATSARQYGGLGLGLYISRQIIEALGGTISVESLEGLGSTFVVTLPVTPP